MKKPSGALSKEELLALVKPGQVIYKVYIGDKGGCDPGTIHEVRCLGLSHNGSYIKATVEKRCTYFKNWYEKNWDCIFDNYFHALAYSLKLKAEHAQKPNQRNELGWRVPREGTKSHLIYQFHYDGLSARQIHALIGGSRNAINALIFNMKHPDHDNSQQNHSHPANPDQS
jgi:hypothetical protein